MTSQAKTALLDQDTGGLIDDEFYSKRNPRGRRV